VNKDFSGNKSSVISDMCHMLSYLDLFACSCSRGFVEGTKIFSVLAVQTPFACALSSAWT